MNKILFKIRAIKRKNDIDVMRCEKKSLERLLLDALSNRGGLNNVQRSQVLSNVVEQWKERQRLEEAKKRKKFLEAEEANDVSKGITMYGLIDEM